MAKDDVKAKARRYETRGQSRSKTMDYSAYIDKKKRPDVFKAWKDIKKDPASEAAQYWRGRMGVTEGDDSRLTRKAFGQALVGESQDIAAGRYKGDLGPGIAAAVAKGSYREGTAKGDKGYMKRVVPQREGGVIPPPKTPGDDNGDEGGNGGNGSTTLKPDYTPSLRDITSDMDLRDMITNVLDKNNPLFKQAKTRAMQAMAARGIVNSSMAEEAVMSAIMNVAIPIATDVTNTYKEAMHKYADTGDLMKRELNQAFYEELITRVNNANQIKLREMTETGASWRAIMDAKSQAANIKGGPEFERYMAMLSKLG